jgi:quercetin dioxygenase-like cupin family protein
MSYAILGAGKVGRALAALLLATTIMAPAAVSPAGSYKRIYRAGECWYETPGAHHLIGRNASNTEPAKLLAVFVADTGDNALTIPDQAGGLR